MADLEPLIDLVAQLLKFDPWEPIDGECDPNPSDAFEQGANIIKDEAVRLLKGVKDNG